MKNKLSKGFKKHIRKEKAKIRKKFLSIKLIDEAIEKLYKKKK